ncbi:MAG TPA: polysaccharide biosynthesis/export family protein, partial [Paludibacter sp.]
MQKPLIQLLFAILLAFELTSCITTHQTNYLQAPKNLNHNYKDSISYEDYSLKEGDKLFIQVYSTDSKTNALFNGSGNSGMQMLAGSDAGETADLYTYSVMANGNIQFPIIGEIYVKGKTLRETKKAIEEAIRPLLKINSVDVRMIGRAFSVIGAGKSGRFSFPKEKINIFQALAISGDVGLYTDRSKIKILRRTKDGTQIKTFDIRGEDIINSEFYYLEPDDVIFLQPMNAQFFGVTTFWSAVSTVITTVSFVTGVYA